MELSRPALAATFLALALPSAASADDFCVNRAGCAPANTFGAADLQAALDAAAAHPRTTEFDRVLIGPGTYATTTASGFTYTSFRRVEIVGSGRGDGGTRIVAGDPANSNYLMTVAGPNAQRVSGLRLELPGGRNRTGLSVHAEVRDVAVEAAGSATLSTGILASGQSSVDGSTIRLPVPPSPGVPGESFNAGVRSLGGSRLTVRDTEIAAQEAVRSASTETLLQRVDAIGSETTVTLSGTTARIESSLIRVLGDGTAVRSASTGGENASATLTNVTLAGVGSGTMNGVETAAPQSGRSAFTYVVGTVIRGVSRPLVAQTGESSSTATVFGEYSDLIPDGNLAGGPGNDSIAFGGGMRLDGADVRFVSLDGPNAYRLQPDSPLIDAGQPFALGSDSPTDLAGGARIVDGNGDGEARRDIGAFEFVPAPPAAPGPAEPAPQPPAGPSGPVPPAPGPTQPDRPRRGFEFASIRRRGFDLSVKLANRLNEPVAISVQTTERVGSGKKPLFRYRTVRRTIKSGGTLTLTLKAPKRLKSALKAQLSKRGRIVRKPRIAVRDLATGGSEAVAQRLVMRKR